MTNAGEGTVHENELIIEEEKRTAPYLTLEPQERSAGFYGTWQRRGHQSLNGVVICTSIDSGKIMDVEVLSKFCLLLDKKHDGFVLQTIKAQMVEWREVALNKFF